MTSLWSGKKKATDYIHSAKQQDKVKAAKVAKAEAVEIKDKTGKASNVLIRPILTEKGTFLESNGQYLFEVANNATKPEVRKAIKRLYGVMAEKVNIMNVRGKQVRFGRFEGAQKSWKKAMVSLVKGEKIDLYKK